MNSVLIAAGAVIAVGLAAAGGGVLVTAVRAALAAAVRLALSGRSVPVREVVRGRRLLAWWEAAGALRRARRDARAGGDDGTYRLLTFRFPLLAAHYGTLLCGVSGTGKSSEVFEMILSLCDRIGRRGERLRVVLFDAKNEWPAKLHAMLPGWVPIYQLNPLDAARGVRWATADDVRSPAEAYQFATGAAPDQANDANGFFTRATRNVLMDLTIALVLSSGRRWRPRHLAALARDHRLLAAVLKAHPVTRGTVGQVLGARSGRDVLATIASFLNLLLPAFAGWDRCEREVSIWGFLRENAVLVLGWDDGVSDALSPLYTFFLRMLIDQVLLNQDPTDRTFLFVDELGLLGRLDALARACFRGRSSALCATVGVQDVNTLYRIYSHDGAREILANLQTKVFFRLGSRESAEYAAGLIGKTENRRWLRSCSVASTGLWTRTRTTGVQEHYSDRYEVSPDELLHTPLADPVRDRLYGYALSPFLGGAARFEVPYLAAARAVPAEPAFENYRRREPAEQLLAPLSAADVAALGIPMSDALAAALARRRG